MMKFLRRASVVVGISILTFWSLYADAGVAPRGAKPPAYEDGSACYQRLHKDRAARASAERWNECIALFEAHARARAGSPSGASATFSAARLSKEMAASTGNKQAQERALEYYNHVVGNYPSSNLADDALLQIALIRQQRGERARSASALKALVERYPDSDSAPQARAMLAPAADKREAKPKEAPLQDTAEAFSYRGDEQRISTDKGRRSARSSAGIDDVSMTPTMVGAGIEFSDEPASSKNPGILIGIAGVQEKNDTIVTLSLNRPVDYRVTFDGGRTGFSDTPSLAIVLRRTHPHAALPKEIAISSPLIRNARIKPRVLGGTQLIFDLAGGTRYALVNHRRSLDVVLSPPAGSESQINPRAVSLAEAAKLALPSELRKPKDRSFKLGSLAFWKRGAKQGAGKRYTVVVDPGHGGDEDGAIGPHGIKEKDIVLAIALKLADEIERQTDARVLLTRRADKPIPLKDRAVFAKKKKADLFISIHANASTDPRHAGIETYYLNNASDEAANKLALRENESWKGSRSDIDRVLATMLQNDVSDESRLLAHNVQKSLVTHMAKLYKGVRDRKARSALFYVLVGTPCPSILVETSFISNPREEMRLADPTYQQQIAYAIAQGVKEFRSLPLSAAASL